MSKRGMPWLQFYPADWLSDSVHGCTPAARGVWMDMLCIMHGSPRYGYLESEGKPIPDELMFRRCGCSSVEEYRNLLAELFSAGVPSRTPEGVIYNRRMVRDQSERDSTAQRVRRHRERVACNAPVTPMYAVEVRSHKSEVRSHKSEKETPTAAAPPRERKSSPLSEESEKTFEQFYSVYPKKVGRPSAKRAFNRIISAAEHLGEILLGIERWKASGQWTEQRFIPNPATFLNDRRWEDEPGKVEKGSNGKQSSSDLAMRNARALGLTTGEPN